MNKLKLKIMRKTFYITMVLMLLPIFPCVSDESTSITIEADAIIAHIPPNFTNESHNRPSLYIEKGDYDRAIMYCTLAIEKDPNFADMYYWRAVAYNAKRDFDKAIVNYTQAIRLDSNYANAYSGRAIAYLSKKNYDRAIADFETVLQINPKDVEAKTGLEGARRFLTTK